MIHTHVIVYMESRLVYICAHDADAKGKTVRSYLDVQVWGNLKFA
jgi:hypothetical protein